MITGPSMAVTPPAVRSQAAATAASTTPATRPEHRAERPEQERLRDHDLDDLAAVRARGAQQAELADALATVIASVLRITNAAANRLIAASSAIVERMSAVDGAQRRGDVLRRVEST